MSKENNYRRQIFAIEGLPPEVLAVAMAKYSRSAASIKETIDELTEEKTAEFHEKWVLGYGDASVADMAMVKIALENVSILASKVIEDNRIACFQEKSTRYQPFDSDRYFKPKSVMNSKFAMVYVRAMDRLFAGYNEMTTKMMEHYRSKYPNRDASKPKTYEKKLRARALDVARYLLPAGTLTNFGLVMSARALRHCISKAMGHPLPELQEIGEEIRSAAVGEAYNPQSMKLAPVMNRLRNVVNGSSALVDEIERGVNLQIKGAPTLVRYCEPKAYYKISSDKLRSLANAYLRHLPTDTDYRVRYFKPVSFEDELVCNLLFSHSRASYRQIGQVVEHLLPEQKRALMDAAIEDRSEHDWPRREFEVGTTISFDVLMDYGAFRDLQRHRLCTQINQELNMSLGYETPQHLIDAGLRGFFDRIIEDAQQSYEKVATEFPIDAQYMIPMAFRKRTIFKMNLRELYHIVELRTKAGGHFSYRALCYEMFEQFRLHHPDLAAHMRAVKMNFDEDFYER